MALLLQRTHVPLALAAVLLLGGCSSSDGETTQSERIAPQSVLQALPSPAQLNRTPQPAGQAKAASADFPNDIALVGSEFRADLSNNRAVLEGEVLTLSSGFSPEVGLDGAGFAIFSFDQPAAERLPQIHAIWDTAPDAQNIYLGIANFETNRWDWPQTARAGETVLRDSIQFAAWSPYLAPSDSKVYVAVILLGSEFVKLRKLRAGEPFFTEARLSPTAAIVPCTVAVITNGTQIQGSDQTVSLETDFTGDGIADANTQNPQFLFSLPGLHPVTLTSTDEDEMSASRTMQFNALAGSWDFEQLAEPQASGDGNFWPVAGKVDGRIAVAYVHEESQDPDPPLRTVEYMIAEDEAATSWLGPVTVHDDPANQPTRVCGILDIAGKPAVVFFTDLFFVEYILGDGALPASWTGPIALSNTLNEDSGVNATMTEGHPYVVFTYEVPFAGWRILYTRADTADGIGDWTTGVIGPGKGDVGVIADAEGPPLVAAHDADINQVNIYASEITNGMSPTPWPVFRQIASGPAGIGVGPMLVQRGENAGNRSMMAFRGQLDQLGKSLITNSAGSYFREIDLTADSWFSGTGPVLNHQNAFCCYESTDQDLYFVRFNQVGDDVSWLGGDTPADSGGDVGQHGSVLEIGTIPIIVYEDTTNRSIKLARMI